MKNIIKLSIFLTILTFTGCINLNKKEEIVPPSVSTHRVIESLSTTKEILEEAGEQNTSVGKKIDKALSLAEKLDLLLQQIQTTNNKDIIPYEK